MNAQGHGSKGSEEKRESRVMALRVMPVSIVALFILSGMVVLVPMPVQAATTYTWNAPSAGDASLNTNWDPVGVPTTGDSVTFDGTSTYSCAWNIATTLVTFTINTGYTGTITLSQNFQVSVFSMVAGTLTAATKTISVSTSFTHTGGTITSLQLSIDLIGSGATIQTTTTLYDLAISDDSAITGTVKVRRHLTVDAGKTMTVPSGGNLAWYTHASGVLTNDGVITGAGSFSAYSYNVDRTITFGAISTAVVQFNLQPGGTSNTVTLDEDTVFTNSIVSIISGQSGQIQTLDLSTNNYNLTCGRVAINTNGQLNARAGSITLSGSASTIAWDSAATAVFIPGASTVVFDDDAKTISTQPEASFYNLVISGDTSTLTSINVTNNLTVDPHVTFTVGPGKSLYYSYNGDYSNLGTLKGTGSSSVVYLFETEDKTIAFGNLSVSVIIRATASATANRTLTTIGDTYFGRSLLIDSLHPTYWMILDTTSGAVTVVMGFTNGTHCMVYYSTEWVFPTASLYSIYANETGYYAKNMNTGTIEYYIDDYADQAVQYAVNETRLGGVVNFEPGTFVFECADDFYVGGWNRSVLINDSYQLTISGSIGNILKFRDNTVVSAGNGIAIFVADGTTELVRFTGLNFETSTGIVATYWSAVFTYDCRYGLHIDNCTFTGMKMALWGDGSEFGTDDTLSNMIVDNAFYNAAWGFALHNTPSGTLIARNTFTDVQYGMFIDSVNNVLVTRNIFIDSGETACVRLYDHTSNITVTENDFDGESGGGSIGVDIYSGDGKADCYDTYIEDNSFAELDTAIWVRGANNTEIASNNFLLITNITIDSGTDTTINGNVNYSFSSAYSGDMSFTWQGVREDNSWRFNVISAMSETKDVTLWVVDGNTLTFCEVNISSAESYGLSFAYDSVVLSVEFIMANITLNCSLVRSDSNTVCTWATQVDTGAVTYSILTGLDSTVGYRVYQDGDVIATGNGPTLTFTATGGGEFMVEVWYGKQVSTLIVMTVNMVGLGIFVAVVAGWVIPFSRAIKAGTMKTNEQMMKNLMKGVVFIIIALLMWGMLQHIAIG